VAALVPMLLELEQARSIAEIGALLRSIAAPLGYDHVLVFAAGTGLERGAHRVYWIEGDWLGEGRETDLARYLHACPVNRHVLDSDAPFFWSKRDGARGPATRWSGTPAATACMACMACRYPCSEPRGWKGRSVSPERSSTLPRLPGCCWSLPAQQHSAPPAGWPKHRLNAPWAN